MLHLGVTDIAAIRRAALERIYPKDKFGPAELSRLFGRSMSFWTQIRDEKKSFGERLARDIERLGDLAPGVLDQAEGEEGMNLTTELLSAMRRLNAKQARQTEQLLRAHLGLPALPDQNDLGKLNGSK